MVEVEPAVGGQDRRRVPPWGQRVLPEQEQEEEPKFKLSNLLRSRKGEKNDVEKDHRQ